MYLGAGTFQARGIVITTNLKWKIRPGVFQDYQEDKYCSGKEEEMKLDYRSEGGIRYLKDVAFLS